MTVANSDSPFAFRRAHWFYICLIGLVLSLLWYHNFQAGQIDNSETLTFMKMFLDPSLYPDTFILQQANSVHYYSLYYLIIGLIGKIVDPYWGLYGYFLAINCLCICGIFYLAYTVTKSVAASYLSVLALTLQWQLNHSLGGSTSLGHGPFPDQMATGLLLFGFAFFLQKRFWVASAVIGLTFNVHASFSLFAGFMCVVSLFVRKEHKISSVFLLLALVFSSPTLVLMLTSPIFESGMDFSEWLYLVRLRSWGHVMPSGFGAHYLSFFPYIMIAVYTLFLDRSEIKKNIRSILLAVVILCVAGTVFTEMIPIQRAIQLTLFRPSIFVVIFAVILWCDYLMKNLKLVCGWNRFLILSNSSLLLFGVWPLLLVSVPALAFIRRYRAIDNE